MKKKILIGIIVAVVVVGAVYAATHLPRTEAGIPELENGFGIYGSEVKFDGVYPGYSGNATIIIINGQDKDRIFFISVTEASKLTKGYEAFPKEYFYWVTIEKNEVSISPGGTEEIPITLSMPGDADYAGKHAEFRIRVGDLTQTGLVQIALESKWYIITAS